MTRISNNRPDPPPGPVPRQTDAKPKLSRQKLERMSEDQTYLALRARYLADNPRCAYCGEAATQIHHLCGGPNRRISLTNENTWLEVCEPCHRVVEGLDKQLQVFIKAWSIMKINEGYRK